MSGDVDAAFRRFVTAERPALLAEALRLTGDPQRAEDAVQAALVRTRLRWGRRGRDPRETAGDAVADAAAGGRLLGREQVVESIDALLPEVRPGPVRWRLGPDDAAADALRRARRQRRLRTGTVAVVVAAGAVAVPLVAGDEGSPSTAAPAAVSAEAAGVPVLVEPTRGSLSADRALVEAVRRREWGALVPPPVAERQVVLVTDTPAGRVALVAGVVDEDVRGVWLTGPVGAAAAELTPVVPQHLGPDRPAALVVGGPGPATLVVVAGRDDVIEVSPRVQVGPRGTVGRTYEPVPTSDGLAVVPVPTTTGGPGTSIRVRRDGQVIHRSGVDAPGLPVPAADVPPLQPLRPAAALPAPRAVAAALTEVAVPLGVEPAALEPQLLWSGVLPLDEVPGSVAVVVARSPGGGLVVTTWAAQVGPGGGGRAVPCGVHTPPGAADVAELVVARVCDLSSPETEPSDQGRWLVVTAPGTVGSAAVLDERGGVLATVPLAGGGAVLLLPEGARTVRTLDAGGRAVGDVPIAAAATGRFGDYGSGPVR